MKRDSALLAGIFSASTQCLILLIASSCASREDRSSGSAGRLIDDRTRSWKNIEPKWPACEAFGADEFPPLPKTFKLVENEATKLDGQVNWTVVDCESGGSCNTGAAFGSAFILDSKLSTSSKITLLGRPVVKWTEDASSPKCRYLVTTPTLKSSGSKAPLRLSVELKAFEVVGPCRPSEVNLDELKPMCTAVRAAESD